MDEALLWIMYLYFSSGLKLNTSQCVWFLQTSSFLTSQDVNWWTGVVWITCGLLWCFYQLFGLSFWRHPFTAEHPLLSQWCRDTFLQIWWRNKLILILDELRMSTFSANVYFWLNYYFNIWNSFKVKIRHHCFHCIMATRCITGMTQIIECKETVGFVKLCKATDGTNSCRTTWKPRIERPISS